MTQQHSKDPLHGVTLAMMLERLDAHCGWDLLARMIPIRCFQHHPSIKSSLTFLRKTPWARAKVEALYRELLPEMEQAPNPSSAHESHPGDDLTGDDLT